MAKTIAVFNQKGGVGKSTTTASLIAGLTLMGKNVLGMDIDPQGHLTKFCGIDSTGENTVLEMFKDQASFVETVKDTKYGDILPCDRELQNNILSFSADANFVFKIKDIIDDVAKKYDYIIIDCPPSANQVTTSALVAADFVIVPTEAEYFSLDGVNEIAKTINQVKKRLNTKLVVLGILLVKYQPKRILTRELEELLTAAAMKLFNSTLFKAKIRFTVDIPASQALKQSIYDYKQGSNACEDYMALTNEILEGINLKKEIKKESGGADCSTGSIADTRGV